jgi:hypothetical protein
MSFEEFEYQMLGNPNIIFLGWMTSNEKVVNYKVE